MKGIRVWFFLFLCAIHGSAQVKSARIDERKFRFYANQLDTLSLLFKEGRIKGDSRFCRREDHIRYSLPGSNVYFPREAFSYSGIRKDHYLEMCVLEKQATELFEEKKYAEALVYWQEALAIAMRDHFLMYELHYIRVALNNIYFLLGDFEKAMAVSIAGLSASEKGGDKERMAHFSNVLGCILLKLKNLGAARTYFERELALGKDMADGRVQAHAILNLADLSLEEGRFAEAVALVKAAAATYERIKPYDLEERRTFCLFKISESLKRWGKIQEALSYSRLVMKDVERVRGINLYDVAGFSINAAELFLKIGQTDSAMTLLHLALPLARTIHHREYTRDACYQLASAFALKGRMDSAYVYQRYYYDLRDSLLNENNERAILQGETRLQLERQSRLQELALAEQKIWRNIAIAVAALALLLLAFFYNRNRLRRKNLAQREQIRRQNELFNIVADTQEQERKRFAQDLHDGLGSVLSAARLKLSALKRHHPEINADPDLQSGIQLLDEASSELRSISYNIMPATLSKLGLVPALKNLAEKISSAGELKVTFITYDLTERLSEQAELSIYRIVLELFNNVVKHSGATRATVQLIRYPGYINITVEDNGNGFDAVKTSEDRTGIGLGSVYARVEYLKGRIDIDSAPGKGTTIFIEIPV